MSPRERLEARSEPVPGTGCLLWTGAVDTSGYGIIGVNRRLQKTHRLAYEISVGPIPDGLQVLHKCDTRTCVNPAHLFVGTIADNMADRNRKGRQAKNQGMRSGLAKLNDQQVLEIRRRYAQGGISMRQLAREYGVTKYPIQRIINRVGWTHLGD